MTSFIIGGIFIVLGVLCSTYVRIRIKNKNVEIQYMKTTAIGELKKTMEQNAADGLEGYREYVELKGVAGSEFPQKTPYSEKEVAYYNADLYQVFEEMETYTDDKGTHQRVKRNESHMSNQKSSGPILLNDPQTGDSVCVELTQMGMQLDTVKSFDKFENNNMMHQYSFFNSYNYNPMGARTLGFRMTEMTIPLGQSLYVLGEAYTENERLYVGKPTDSKKPFIVSVKSETDLVQGNKSSANFALFGGIALAVIGVLFMIFVR